MQTKLKSIQITQSASATHHTIPPPQSIEPINQSRTRVILQYFLLKVIFTFSYTNWQLYLYNSKSFVQKLYLSVLKAYSNINFIFNVNFSSQMLLVSSHYPTRIINRENIGNVGCFTYSRFPPVLLILWLKYIDILHLYNARVSSSPTPVIFHQPLSLPPRFINSSILLGLRPCEFCLRN